MDSEDPFRAVREAMVREQLEARGIHAPGVLAALREVPRHAFVPASLRDQAYADGPLPIGRGQTISQPLIVATMTAALALGPTDRVLEIGTGSGYQTAVLAELAAEVHTIELEETLLRRAQVCLGSLGYTGIRFHRGDGAQGWPEAAPYDAIILTCAPREIPAALREQLAVGGRLVAPHGPRHAQTLELLRRDGSGWTRQNLGAVRFVELRH